MKPSLGGEIVDCPKCGEKSEKVIFAANTKRNRPEKTLYLHKGECKGKK